MTSATATVPDVKTAEDAATKGALKRRAITSLGDKGGSSKSFLVRKLAEMHLDAHTAGLMLVDGDQTVGALFKFYGERDADGAALMKQGPRGVQMFGLHGKVDARDRFVNDLLRRGADLVVADLPATVADQTAGDIRRIRFCAGGRRRRISTDRPGPDHTIRRYDPRFARDDRVVRCRGVRGLRATLRRESVAD